MAMPENTRPAAPTAVKLISVFEDSLMLDALGVVLGTIGSRVIACSGGIDSLLLATVAHRLNPDLTLIAHAVSPAVPAAATHRVKERAASEGWNLRILSSGEFGNENYLSNPSNRCYYCKSNLYESLEQVGTVTAPGATLLSGANVDDLGEYRPGLTAAEEHAVRHPYIETGINKAMIRAIARHLKLPFAELPASPCLASRLYTGTRVTEERLRAIEDSENLIRTETGIQVVRCRMRENEVWIEVSAEDRGKITGALLTNVLHTAQRRNSDIKYAQLDPENYAPGRAFVVTP